MSSFFSKIAKLMLWVVVSTLLMSGAKNESPSYSNMYTESDYTIEVSGSLNNNFSGKIAFETSNVSTSKGVSFSVLKLKLENKETYYILGFNH